MKRPFDDELGSRAARDSRSNSKCPSSSAKTLTMHCGRRRNEGPAPRRAPRGPAFRRARRRRVRRTFPCGFATSDTIEMPAVPSCVGGRCITIVRSSRKAARASTDEKPRRDGDRAERERQLAPRARAFQRNVTASSPPAGTTARPARSALAATPFFLTARRGHERGDEVARRRVRAVRHQRARPIDARFDAAGRDAERGAVASIDRRRRLLASSARAACASASDTCDVALDRRDVLARHRVAVARESNTQKRRDPAARACCGSTTKLARPPRAVVVRAMTSPVSVESSSGKRGARVLIVVVRRDRRRATPVVASSGRRVARDRT